MTRKVTQSGKSAAPHKASDLTPVEATVRIQRSPVRQRTKNAERGQPQAAPEPAAKSPAAAKPARSAPSRTKTPPIQIELDSGPTGGFINGRFDAQLRGRVAATLPIEAVELIAEGRPVSRLAFGEPNQGSSTTMRHGEPGQERSFQFSLQREQAISAGECTLLLRVAGPDGPVHEQAFTLKTDPRGPVPVQIASGPRRPLLALLGLRPPIVLYVEKATHNDRGGFLMHGWAVAMDPLVTVQAFLGEHRLPAAQLGVVRDDVAVHYPNYPNAGSSGFTLTAQVTEPAARDVPAVRVQAISRNGCLHEVVVPLQRNSARRRPEPARSAQPVATPERGQDRDAPAAPPAAAPVDRASSHGPATETAKDAARDYAIRHFCDAVQFEPDGTLQVVGWAVCAAGLREIAIELDGKPVGTAELGLPRPDVGEEFADIPSAESAGFRFERAFPQIAEGDHDVRIALRSKRGDESVEIRRVHATAPIAGTPRRSGVKAIDQTEFRFELDSPQVVAGKVVEPVTGRLTIEGWVVAHSGVESVEVYLDDQRLGQAHYGLVRQDVGAAFPNWDNALRSGYTFHCPPRALHDGEHVVKLEVLARNGQVLARDFRIDVKKADDEDQFATIRRRMGHLEANMLAEVLDSLGYQPRFHLLLCQGTAATPDGMQATLESLLNQRYSAWQVTVLAEDIAAASATRGWLAEHEAEFGDRVRVLDATQPEFAAPLVASGNDATLFSLLCPGDLLGCDALAEIALAGGLHQQPEFLYADEARLSPASNEREPFFKPDFSPDLLLSTNYIGRPWFATGSLLLQCEATPRSLFATGEYDLVLRCTEQARSIHHVPKLLAQRGMVALDDEATSRIALGRAAERRGFAVAVRPGCLPGIFRLQRTQPAKGKVSIIIPTCAAHGHIETCIRTLREKTAYKNFEVVCIDNIPAAEPRWKVWLQQNADQIVEIPDAFNWSRFNNAAAAATDGEYLLFLNDDIEITQADWLDALLEHAQRPEVGVVGPQLLYPGGRVQHAGMFLGSGVGRHAFRSAPQDDPGYFGLALTQRNVIAVTGACMLMRRSFFDAMGGFEEAHSVINNDLDFCLRAHQAGKLIVYTPHASLLHHELASRDRLGDGFDTTQFDARWRTMFAAGDPYFNPRLSRQADDYRPDDEATQTVFPGHPLFVRDEINKILVVKLDHIGDFTTALPAIRRLKALFPQASISVLAGKAARFMAALEPSIDEFIEFEFFHARSQLGEKELSKGDFEALGEQLAPHRFDLAVDLRKHLSTRDVLRYTGARFLAGYDYVGQFPFLDIALEWDGDKTLQRKRNHVVDDLLALVEAVNTASLDGRNLQTPPPEPIGLESLPERVQALFERPVIAIHAGAGNTTKQWPEGYFSALIDLLLERDMVNVLLIGGPDDHDLSRAIAERALLPDRVESIAGELSLSDLPRLLVRCQLYIGNDSGPKHIAAAVGVPTIGIHSGVVDAVEWGPVGRRAMALRRNMACSPCYLARAEDCPRGLACLRFLEPAVVHEAAQMLLARPVPAPSRAEPAVSGSAGSPALSAAKTAQSVDEEAAEARARGRQKSGNRGGQNRQAATA